MFCTHVLQLFCKTLLLNEFTLDVDKFEILWSTCAPRITGWELLRNIMQVHECLFLPTSVDYILHMFQWNMHVKVTPFLAPPPLLSLSRTADNRRK